MSLLLKALQNAAKNREAAGAERSEPALEAAAGRAAAPTELSLEPVQPTPRGSARVESAGGDPPAGERQAAPGPQHAQSVLRAGAAARTQRPPRHEPGILDWLARRPLVAFSTAAGLFAIGYGIYLYLQLTNPGIFIAKPPPQPPRPSVAAAPPPQPPAPRPPAAAPAPAPGLQPSAAPAPPSVPSAASLPTGATLPQPPARADTGTPGTAPAAGTPPASTLPASTPVPPQPTAAPVATAAADSPTPARATPERPSAPPAVAASAPRRSEPASAAGTMTPSAPGAAGGVKAASIETGTVPPATRPRPPRARPKAPAAAAPELPEGVAATGASQVVAVDRIVQEAYQALAQGRVDEAERLYRQSLASDARNVDAMLGLAAVLAQKHQGEAASQLYMRVLEQDPRNTYAQAGLLNLAGHADPMAAEARLKQLIAADPSAFLYFTLGNLYAERGQWAAAQGAYFQAHKLDPDNPDYAFNLAVGLEHLSQPKIALDYYRRAMTLAQARGNAQFELARVENRIRSLESTLAVVP